MMSLRRAGRWRLSQLKVRRRPSRKVSIAIRAAGSGSSSAQALGKNGKSTSGTGGNSPGWSRSPVGACGAGCSRRESSSADSSLRCAPRSAACSSGSRCGRCRISHRVGASSPVQRSRRTPHSRVGRRSARVMTRCRARSACSQSRASWSSRSRARGEPGRKRLPSAVRMSRAIPEPPRPGVGRTTTTPRAGQCRRLR
jgi:hypothetical protein